MQVRLTRNCAHTAHYVVGEREHQKGPLGYVGHWFTKIDDHISYLMVRIDPDKVTPLKGEAQSRDYLSKPARK